jgi:hypothetical protein
VKEEETNISESAALSVDATAYGKVSNRVCDACTGGSSASPDGAPFSAKASRIFFGGHVFDTVLSKIRRDWGLGAFA